MATAPFLDWPFFEPHHRQLAAELESWCQTELDGHHDEVDSPGKPRDRSDGSAYGTDTRMGVREHECVHDMGGEPWQLRLLRRSGPSRASSESTWH